MRSCSFLSCRQESEDSVQIFFTRDTRKVSFILLFFEVYNRENFVERTSFYIQRDLSALSCKVFAKILKKCLLNFWIVLNGMLDKLLQSDATFLWYNAWFFDKILQNLDDTRKSILINYQKYNEIDKIYFFSSNFKQKVCAGKVFLNQLMFF